nr:hypothetical protein [Tanacetum cinerariifolium]
PKISKDELTLAQTLIEIKAAKPKAIITVTAAGTQPKAKGIIIQEPSETPTPTPKVSSQQPSKVHDKAQMKAKIEEEERIAREKVEANIAVIEKWDEVQAMIDANMELS